MTPSAFVTFKVPPLRPSLLAAAPGGPESLVEGRLQVLRDGFYGLYCRISDAVVK